MSTALEIFAALATEPAFADRHIGPAAADIAAMLAAIGATSLEDVVQRAVPAAILGADLSGLPEPASEEEVLAELAALAARNRADIKSLIGLGYYGTYLPPVIRRNVLENPGWYTAYTPYQAEIAQGRLEALLNFQTMISDLTGLPVANASLLDEATAVAEAMHLAQAATRGRSSLIMAAADLLPQSKAVLTTRAAPLGLTCRFVAPSAIIEEVIAARPSALILQYPGSSGEVRDLAPAIAAVQSVGGLAIVAADPLALCLLTPPGEMGADVVVGSAQRFGVPMGFGGPHAAFMAVKDAYKRLIPGRLVGVSRDAAGAPALRLALQTREQHIRREKATSNICTAQVLLAVIASLYAVWHGPQGLKRIAHRVHLAARLLGGAAEAAGLRLKHRHFFDTIAIEAGEKAAPLITAALARGYNLARLDPGVVGIAMDETVGRADLEALAAAIAEVTGRPAPLGEVAGEIPPGLERRSAFLTAAVFNTHQAEHAMLRYIKALEEKDIALTRSMIPLGSCTMKLNATAEMIPIGFSGFADIHPFAPPDQTEGYRLLIARLSEWLRCITGLAAVSLQPNAGSQGEYAGLLAIRAYHRARGEGHRDVCLIPASAHGTNPASAAMAGMRVVVVATDRDGSIDVADLRAKVAQYATHLAALMVTYPSTHGVFEEAIRDICDLIHAHGGLVYMDGANMNAQLGLTSPGRIGADVCHLNLHKTFCIPHGGGGPGVGPIAVSSALAPFLPGHPLVDCGGDPTIVVSAAPWGSASILPISYAYIRLMGAAGLRRATAVAILAANYIAQQLEADYPVLYRGRNGMVAHECILDCRHFQQSAGVMVEDIAKRLQDYGFHAPTMSWPVAGTLMVEPTESEPKAELDRFIAAMRAIRAEIRAIEEGQMDRQDNPLKNAPHTAAEIAAAVWSHPYSREQAAFPLPFVRGRKYWPPVKRVDNVYGDRHLVCSCAPLEAYAQAAGLAAA